MNYYAVDLYLMDSVCVCVCMCVCRCVYVMHVFILGCVWEVCNYVWMYSACSLTLVFLETIKE